MHKQDTGTKHEKLALYNSQLISLLSRLASSPRTSRRPQFHHVLPALLGQKRRLSDTLDSQHSATFSQLVAEGYYVNSSLDDNELFVPAMTVVSLYRFTTSTQPLGVAKIVATCLQHMIRLEPNWYRKSYEFFPARFEMIRRTLLQHKDEDGLFHEQPCTHSLTLEQLYPGCMYNPMINMADTQFDLQDTDELLDMEVQWMEKATNQLKLQSEVILLRATRALIWQFQYEPLFLVS